MDNKKGSRYFPAIILVAGESGIAMACRLKKTLGFDDFCILDRQSDVGGTWHINTYPRIKQYLVDVCRKFGIADKIQLNSEVVEAKWMEEQKLWRLIIHRLHPGFGDIATSERRERVRSQGADAVIVRTEILFWKILISGLGGAS